MLMWWGPIRVNFMQVIDFATAVTHFSPAIIITAPPQKKSALKVKWEVKKEAFLSLTFAAATDRKKVCHSYWENEPNTENNNVTSKKSFLEKFKAVYLTILITVWK